MSAAMMLSKATRPRPKKVREFISFWDVVVAEEAGRRRAKMDVSGLSWLVRADPANTTNTEGGGQEGNCQPFRQPSRPSSSSVSPVSHTRRGRRLGGEVGRGVTATAELVPAYYDGWRPPIMLFAPIFGVPPPHHTKEWVAMWISAGSVGVSLSVT